VGVCAVTVAHIGAYEGLRLWLMQLFWTEPMKVEYTWWNLVKQSYFQYFDWEMMTYWAIIGAFHSVNYYREFQDGALKAARLETQLAEAQLQALQRQLHPHFLFNTLNAISALMHRDVEAADQMLSKLSDLLRIALDQRGAQEVALKDELEFLQKYLEIEQTRFGDRLSVDFTIEPQTLDAQVPNLILQPLVENSIRHAVAVRIEPGQTPARDARPVGPQPGSPQARRSGHGAVDRDVFRAHKRGESRDARLLDGGCRRYLPAMEASLSDAALVARCRTGDESAWAELVNRFSRYVYAIATQGFGLRADDAEDVFQEVFARTFQHLDRLRDDEAIRPWIAQLTRRLSIDRIRAGSRVWI